MLEIVTKWNIEFFFYYYASDTKKKKKIDANTEKLTNTRKMKISERYDLFSEPSFDTNWCELCDLMVMQPTIKIEIWSRKAKRCLIGM
jgi:hypothetical protein